MTHPRVLLATVTRTDGRPERQAFLLLRTAFTIAPIVFGLDKFTNILTNWEGYLAPWINDLVPGPAHPAMLLVGVIAIVAGLAAPGRARPARCRGAASTPGGSWGPQEGWRLAGMTTFAGSAWHLATASESPSGGVRTSVALWSSARGTNWPSRSACSRTWE